MDRRITTETILRSEHLPTLPAVASRILLVTGQDDAELSEIVDIISLDASLCARVLKVVNSPLYGLWNPVGTISKAVSLLGINPVKGLVLSFSLLNIKGSDGDGFDYEKFWERSLATAVTARFLLEKLDLPGKEEGFTAGLLANMGQMLLARACPDIYRKVVSSVGQGVDLPIEVAEQEILGIDHPSIGIEVARRWHLPIYLQTVIGHHHSPEHCPETEEALSRLVRVIHLAEIVADIFHSPFPFALKDKFILRSRELLGLEESVFDSLAPAVHGEVKRVAHSFGIRIAAERSLEDILQEANLRLGQIALSYEKTSQELIKTQIELIQLNKSRHVPLDNLHRMSDFDSQTGAYNHRYLLTFLQSKLNRPSRRLPLSLILVGVDDFALSGNDLDNPKDLVLKSLSRIFRTHLRPDDLVARWSGEEFALALPDTDLKAALKIAGRLRGAAAQHTLPGHEGISISIAVTCDRPGENNPQDLTRRAEKALSTAREQGKGAIIVADAPLLTRESPA